MSAPTFTGGSPTSIGTIAASGTSTFTLDVSTNFEARLQVGCTFGTISGTAGLQVSVFEGVGSSIVYATVAGAGSLVLAAVAGAQAAPAIHLPPGRYSITIKNLDPSNSVTLAFWCVDLTPAVA